MGWPDEASTIKAEALLIKTMEKPPEREGLLLRVSSQSGPRVLIDVLRTLDTNNLPPTSLAVREPSLDDVFLALTGRHAEAADAAAGDEAGAPPAAARGRKKRGRPTV